MRKLLFLIGFTFVLLLSTVTTQAEVRVGLSVDNDGLKSFHLAIGEFYLTYDKEIEAVRKLNIPDEELPLVFFFANQTGVGKDKIIRLRLGGKSWMDICFQFGYTAELFYVPVKSNPGPPYGKAYGHFKNKNKKKWNEIRLSDAEIINFVNLKFMSEHYGYSPDEIIKMRAKGKSFIAINGDVKKIKNKHKKQKFVQNSGNNSKSAKNEKKNKGNKKK